MTCRLGSVANCSCSQYEALRALARRETLRRVMFQAYNSSVTENAWEATNGETRAIRLRELTEKGSLTEGEHLELEFLLPLVWK